ncbi:MAG: hypothetical protein ACI8RD_006816 [Bacillariaceae sp.]
MEFLSDRCGYVGRSVEALLGSSLKDQLAQGAQTLSQNNMRAGFVSAVLFQHLRFLKDNDYFVCRLLDNGNSTLWTIGWEGHDGRY